MAKRMLALAAAILCLGGAQKCRSQHQTIKLTFEQGLKLALKNELALQLAQQRIKAAQADLRYSRTRRLPKLSMAGYSGAAQYKGGIPVVNSFSLPAEEFELRPTLYGEVGLYFRQVLFDNKQIYYEIQEKAVMLKKVENEITRAQANTLIQTAITYCKASHVEEQIKYLEEQIELQEQLRSQIDDYFAAGLISKSELEKIQRQLIELQDQLEMAKLQSLELMMRLHIIMKIPKDQVIHVDASHNIDFLRICDQARKGDIQKKNLECADGELVIELNDVRVQRARRHNTISVNLESYLRYSSSQSWVIGIGIHWPLWDAGEREALSDLAEAQHAAAQINLETSKEEIDQRIELSYFRLLLEYEKLRSLDKRINSLTALLSDDDDAQTGLEENLLKMRRRVEFLDLSREKAMLEADYHLAGFEFLHETNNIVQVLAQ